MIGAIFAVVLLLMIGWSLFWIDKSNRWYHGWVGWLIAVTPWVVMFGCLVNIAIDESVSEPTCQCTEP